MMSKDILNNLLQRVADLESKVKELARGSDSEIIGILYRHPVASPQRYTYRQAVFEVLSSAHKPLNRREIVEIIKKKNLIPGVDDGRLRDGVSKALINKDSYEKCPPCRWRLKNARASQDTE